MTAIVEPSVQADTGTITPGVTYEITVATEDDGHRTERTIVALAGESRPAQVWIDTSTGSFVDPGRIVRIERLSATLELDREGSTVAITGTLAADIVQSCAVSAEDLAVAVREPIAVRFVPRIHGHAPDEVIEIDADACDEIEYAGSEIDLGEAVAQSLALAIDPFATGPQADEARRKAGLFDAAASGPFAALAALRKKD